MTQLVASEEKIDDMQSESDISVLTTNGIITSPLMKHLYLREPGLVMLEGVTFLINGVSHPLAFFNAVGSVPKILVGRDPECDLVNPHQDGRCGISRLA